MAYHQDPYSNHGGHGAVPDYPPTTQNVSPGGIFHHPQHTQDYQGQQQGYYQEYDHWDGKSTKSYQSTFAGSQVHLNPSQHDMQQLHNGVPVPTMPYQQSYPPVQAQLRPQMSRGSSSGYTDAREKLMKRRSVRQIELQEGNLVLDMQVPTHIVPAGKNEEEMTKMRYTAATCDPDDFMAMRFTLRPYLYGRHTELFVVMTMYNEDEVLFCRTMNA